MKKKHILFDLDGTLFDSYKKNQPYPHAEETLADLCKVAHLSIVTAGDEKHQWKKIKQSGFEHYFEPIIVVPLKEGKLGAFKRFAPGMGIVPRSLIKSDVIVVGDRIEYEIAYGLQLGYTTIQILQGPHHARKMEFLNIRPLLKVKNLAELIPLVRNGK